MENATKILWIEEWACSVDPKYKHAAIQYEKKKDGTWLVRAKLPFYKKAISKTGNNLMETLLPVADKACTIIEKLIKDNPKLRIESKYVDGHWEILVDDDGEGFTIALSKEAQEIQQKLSDALYNQSKEMLKTISHYIGSTKLTYFHIFDKRIFGEDDNEILENANILIKKLHNQWKKVCRTFISGDSVVSFGFDFN